MLNKMTARTDWLTYPYYKVIDPGWVNVPQPGGTITRMASAEYNLSESISQDIRGHRNFLYAPEELDPQYRSPSAYRVNFVVYATTLTKFSYSKAIVPEGWDPIEAGTRYANLLFDVLKNIPVNQNDPASNNAYDAWIDGTGQFYDGWGPGSPAL